MGSLAFELPNGRIDLPTPDLFVHQLRKECAPRLQCVFLNGCQTAELGYQIVSEMPWLMCICWSTITEDAAARAFATGGCLVDTIRTTLLTTHYQLHVGAVSP